jgi:hypothetical protein
MQQRGLVLSHFSFNPFIREFARWTMIEEVQLMRVHLRNKEAKYFDNIPVDPKA